MVQARVGSSDLLILQLELLLQVFDVMHSRIELHRILSFELVLRRLQSQQGVQRWRVRN